MDGTDELTANLEGTDNSQVESLIADGSIETTNQIGLHALDNTVVSTNGTARCHTIFLEVALRSIATILHLDHTYVSAWLKDVQIGITLLPQSVVFIVVDHVDRIANEPTVAFVSFRLAVFCDGTCQLGQFVAVSIEVDTCFPVPTVLIVEDNAVQCQLPTLVLRFTDVTGKAANT